MATNDQKTLVSIALIDLARNICRGTTDGFIRTVRTPEASRELAQALTDVQLGSMLKLWQDVLCEQFAEPEIEPDPNPAD